MTAAEAIAYLNAHGWRIVPAPRKWQRRGFAHYSIGAGQMLTDADLLVCVTNQQALDA